MSPRTPRTDGSFRNDVACVSKRHSGICMRSTQSRCAKCNRTGLSSCDHLSPTRPRGRAGFCGPPSGWASIRRIRLSGAERVYNDDPNESVRRCVYDRAYRPPEISRVFRPDRNAIPGSRDPSENDTTAGLNSRKTALGGFYEGRGVAGAHQVPLDRPHTGGSRAEGDA